MSLKRYNVIGRLLRQLSPRLTALHGSALDVGRVELYFDHETVRSISAYQLQG